MRILITGGCGFVGHHFVEHFIKNTDADIVIVDRLNYSGSLDRLRDIDVFTNRRVLTLTADFSIPISENVASEMGDVDYIFHLGAESHVDHSITDPVRFIRANVEGTQHIINFALALPDLKRFYYFSTDEVFGSIDEGLSEVDDPHNPSNPYAATKSGGEMMVKAAINTFGLPAIITRTMNVFGERQHPEKFIPLCIRKILKGETIQVHASPDRTKAGSRFYIHARNVADGYLHLLQHGVSSGEYHITGEQEVDNLALARRIADILDRPLYYEMVDFHSSRPGHDLRYALSPKSMSAIGWEPPKTFEKSLEKTVNWIIDHPRWLDLAASG